MAFVQKACAFIKKDFLICRSYKLSFILDWLSMFVVLFSFYFIAQLFNNQTSPFLHEYGGKYFPFVLLGVAFTGYFTSALRSFSGKIREEQIIGTLEAILVTPTRISAALIFMSLLSFILASINLLAYILCGAYFFGMKLSYNNLFTSFIILILSIISFSGMGIISASFVMVFKRGDPLIWFMTTLSMIFGGIFFPPTVLPKGLQAISYFLPITYSLRAIRLSLLQGYSLRALLPEIIALLAFAAALLPLSIFFFKCAVNKAKIDGSLTHY